MRILLFSLFTVSVSLISYGQFYTEDFESVGLGWNTTGPTSENDWRVSTCAGNGNTIGGTTSLYISKGGTQPGCGVDGVDQYAYTDALSGSDTLIRYKQMDASCYTTMSLQFDYKINGDASDFFDVVYSTDGINWTSAGLNIFDQTTWATTTTSVPGIYDNSVFYFGFQFVFNDNTIDGDPLAIDNVMLSGTDNVAPNVLCPANQTLYTSTVDCDAILPDYTSSVTVTDICNDTIVTLAQSTPAGTAMSAAGSPYTITITATDGSSNAGQCQFDVTVIDTVAPTISCPAGPITEYLDGGCSLSIPDYSGLVTASDNCESQWAVTVTQAPPAGAIIGASSNITFTATDNFGISSTCSFVLNAVDTISPTITCPSNDTVGTTTLCNFDLTDYTSFGTPADNCTFTGSISITQSPVIGTALPAGSNTVTLIATDDSGNTGTCVFNIEVEDQTPPVISSCAPNQSVYVDSNCEGTLGDYTSLVTPTDNCTHISNMVFAQSPAPGTTISGSTLVTITVSDEAGNSTNCQFTALLNDTTPPQVTCPADFSLNINSSCEYTIPDITGNVTGTDNCSSFANMNVTQSPAPSSTGEGITNVTIILSDENGNVSTCQTIITPIDTITPTITCPSPAPIDNGSLCDYTITYFGSQASILDNCTGFTIDQSPAVGATISTGTTLVTLTVTDAGGNSASCSFDLTVTENVAPTIVCPSDTASCDPVVTYSLPTYSDNCLDANLVQTDVSGLSSGSTFPVGITTLEYTAIDSSGNMASCTFNVEILPFADPAIIVEDTLGLCNQSSALVEAEAITNGTGQWTVLSGTGTFNNEFAYATGVNGISSGTNVYVWTVSSTSCGSSSDTLVVINSQADLPASTQDTILACTDATVALEANSPLYGTGSWTTSSTGIIDDNGSASTFATLTENGWHDFIWTITNTGCPTTADTVTVLSMRQPIISPEDTTVCIESEGISVAALNLAAGQSVQWYSTSNTVTFDTPNDASTFVSGFGNGDNEVICRFSYEGCSNTSDTLVVTTEICEGFDPVIPTVITPGNIDGKNDLFNIDLLDILYPECHVVIFNRWGSVVYESTGYSEPWDGTYNGALLPMGTYFYKIELNDELQQVFTGDISIIN